MAEGRADDATLEDRNASFWDELCGSALAGSIGVVDQSAAEIARFDRAYLDMYPYLERYLPHADCSNLQVLEVGLGYGTLGGLLIARGAHYTGVDVAEGPVAMMRRRIELTGSATTCVAQQASALDLPFADAAFDRAYSIGCLHHTGDIPRGVAELRRVLRPGGEAVVMLYNRWSARRILRAPVDAIARRFGGGNEGLRASYDSDASGRAAPHTDFVSSRRVEQMFAAVGFRDAIIERRNLAVPHLPAVRRLMLRVRADRFLGLDLYVQATA